MNQPPLNDRQLEKLKKKFGIDEDIAAIHNISVHKVKKELDPRFRKVISKFLEQATKKSEEQNG